MKRRIIRAAEAPKPADTEQIISERLDAINDDFDFFASGIEKLSREGGTAADAAVSILGQFNESLQGFISQMSEAMQ